MMHVTRYRIYPTREQADTIFGQFRLCTELRNTCLDTRNYNVRQLPELKKTRHEFKTIHSNVLQNLLFQIRDNIYALAVLKQKGHRVGRLRHKLVRSLVYEATGYKLIGSRLWLSKIGTIPIVLSRPIPGVIKQIVVKFTKTHRWFVSVISKTTDIPPSNDGGRVVGIDLNLTVFSHDNDGRVVENPRNLKQSLRQLSRAQRRLSRKKKGGKNRKKAKLRVACIHETVKNRRDDFLHKWSTSYVYQSNYAGIAVEKLTVKSMLEHTQKRHLKNRDILDAAWARARSFLRYKAERAGIFFREIDPAYTSQTCSSCGHRQPMPLNIRTFSCPACGTSSNRDLNAARNILTRAFKVGWDTPECTLDEIRTSAPDITRE
jgi:putative transposase